MDIEKIRQTLISEEERLTTMRDGLREGTDLDVSEQMDSGGELSTVDNHPADAASEETQRAVTVSMVEQLEAELQDVEDALRKLDEGTYGICEASGEKIPEERLEAMPTARFTVEEQGKREQEVGMRRTGNTGTTTDATTPI